MKSKFRFRKLYRGGKISLIGGIIATVGSFVIKDLRKEDSIIKHALLKIPFLKKRFLKKYDDQEEDNYRIIENSINTKDQK